MIRLQVFGGFRLELNGDPLTDLRPRVAALLALLAGHGPSGTSRDKLVAYLWPDSDAGHARNSLKQALFFLRRSLGRDAVIAGSASLRLDPNLIQVDLWEFEWAVEAGDLHAAAARYQGVLLDGFYTNGLPEFEHWVEGERQKLERRYLDALLLLAREAGAHGAPEEAVRWWRRLAEADPLSSATAVGLMRALVGAGDPAAALEYARQHAATVRRELDLDVEEPVLALVRELRAEAARQETGPAPRSHPLPPWRSREELESGAPATLAIRAWPGRSARLSGVLGASDRWQPRELRKRWVLAWSLLVVLSVLAARGYLGRAPAAGSDQASSLVVLPFAAAGDSVGELGAALAHLVTVGLDGLEEIRAVPLGEPAPELSAAVDSRAAASLAARAGARLYVTGFVARTNGRLRATATLHDRGNVGQQVARAEAESEGNRLLDLADELVAGLIASRIGPPSNRLARAAAGGTRSLVALRAYLEGERRLRNAELQAAVAAFRRAVRADTAFALAYYRLSVAADRDGRSSLALWAGELAVRFGERLPERERRLAEAHLVHRRGRLEEAERRYRRIVADYPGDEDAWYQLAELLFHLNSRRGRSVREADAALQRLLELDPDNREGLLHLARIRVLQGENIEADSLLRRVVGARGDSGVVDRLAFRALGMNDGPADELAIPPDLVFDAAVHLGDLARGRALAGHLSRTSGSCELRELGRRMLSQNALARGRYGTARRLLAHDQGCGDGGESLALAAVYQTLVFLPHDRGDLHALQEELEDRILDPELSPAERLVLRQGIGILALARGDTALAERVAAAMSGNPDSVQVSALSWALDQSLRARIALQRGQPERALAFLERTHWERIADPPAIEADDRFLRAELLASLGREEEAEGWYASLVERSFHEVVYLGPALYGLGRTLEGRGNRRAALACYERFVRLWAGAQETRPDLLAQAEERIRGMRSGVGRGNLDPRAGRAFRSEDPSETCVHLVGR